ncbi:DUF1003 domain-containing protein [Fulvimarina endophytica]|nr:DUF1003 domain-containing protein [Fulvimarina endophytica]
MAIETGSERGGQGKPHGGPLVWLRRPRREWGPDEKAVAEAIESNQPISLDPVEHVEEDLTFGERAADEVARFGGSWSFIILFVGVLVVWMIVNSVILATDAFDPYPFILLNLVLSCIAAVQAPVIMMSQRRQDERDRASAENDYRVNLKAELEVREIREILNQMAVQQQAAFDAIEAELRQLRNTEDQRP